MISNFKRSLFPGILFYLIQFAFPSQAQKLVITNTNIQIVGAVKGENVSWASDDMDISIDMSSGVFNLDVPVYNLEYLAPENIEIPVDEANQHSSIIISGVFPIYDVMENNRTYLDFPVDVRIQFRDKEERSQFSLTLTRFGEGQISLMGRGRIHIKSFDLSNLWMLEDEMELMFSIVALREK